MLDLSLSLTSLKIHLQRYLWTNFITSFDPDSVYFSVHLFMLQLCVLKSINLLITIVKQPQCTQPILVMFIYSVP